MKDVVAKTGEYQRDGETKSEWTKVGVILSNDNGEYMLLDPAVNLAGVLTKQNMLAVEQKRAGNDKAKARKSVMCSIFDKNQNSGQGGTQNAAKQDGFPDDDVPF